MHIGPVSVAAVPSPDSEPVESPSSVEAPDSVAGWPDPLLLEPGTLMVVVPSFSDPGQAASAMMTTNVGAERFTLAASQSALRASILRRGGANSEARTGCRSRLLGAKSSW